jgi:molybdopterin/thiamine biosynthesis adenylyltransferase
MSVPFDYARAFERNRGLVAPQEQERLRCARVGIVGCGGAGGVHAASLARTGIGRFRLIDPDDFEVINFNRQIGATMSTIGRPKATVIGEMVREINPGAEIDATEDFLTAENVDSFLEGVDLVADGLDFFAIDARIMLARACQARGIPFVSSGPIGMSATMQIFAPGGMPYERYFDIHPDMSLVDKLVAFLVGITPRMSQRSYMDMRYANLEQEYGPSLGAACMICAGVVGIEALRLLLGRPGAKLAPHYYQFDAYRRRLYRGYLLWGNRNPVQRLKRWIAKRVLTAEVQGVNGHQAGEPAGVS